jgi:tetratricopeptide (TPR) repeat protein
VLEDVRKRLEEDEDGERGANAVLLANPDFHEVRRLRARKRTNDQHYIEALADWRTILGDFPDDKEALAATARLLERQGDFTEARDLWQQLASKGGSAQAQRALDRLPKTMLTFGKQAFAEGRLVDAWNAFSLITEDNHLYVEAQRQIDRVQRHTLKHMRESYRHNALDEVLALAPVASCQSQISYELFRFVAKAAAKLRKFDQARDAWTALLELDPNTNFEACIGLARAELALGEIRKAKKVWERAASQQPQDAEVLKTAEMIRVAEQRGT